MELAFLKLSGVSRSNLGKWLTITCAKNLRVTRASLICFFIAYSISIENSYSKSILKCIF